MGTHDSSILAWGNLWPLLIGLYSIPPAEITIKEFLHAEFKSHATRL